MGNQQRFSVAQPHVIWARHIDGKLQQLYRLRDEKCKGFKEEIQTLIAKRGMMFEEYEFFLKKGSSGVFVKPSILSKEDYFSSNSVDFGERFFNGDDKQKKDFLESKKRKHYFEYKQREGDERVSYSVSLSHAFQFLESFYRARNGYNYKEKLKDFLDYNAPDMEGYIAFLESIAKIIPKPFESLYKKHACYIPTKSLQLHSYITGATGSGKTELIKFLIHNLGKTRKNAPFPRALIVIEPDWKMCHELARHKEFDREKSFLFDVDLDGRTIEDGRKLPSYNPFDFPHKDIASIDAYAQSLANAFEGAIGKDFTPHMKDVVRSCFMVLLRWEGATLTHDFFNMLSEDKCQPYIDFAKKNLESDEREVFENDFTSDAFNYTKSSLRVKFRSLLNPVFRRVIGQKNNSFDIEKIVNEGGIGLFALRGLGREGGSLLGSLLMARIQHICFNRGGNPTQKPETFLFVDECHNYINSSIDTTLSEGRKHKIFLSLASQFQGKNMEPGLRETVITNTNLKLGGIVPPEKQAQTAKNLGVTAGELDTLTTGEFFLRDINLTRQRTAFKIYVPSWYVDTRGQIEGEEWGAYKIEQLNAFYSAPREKEKPIEPTQERKRPESSKQRAERIIEDFQQENKPTTQPADDWAFDE